MLRQCATTAITAVHAASIMFAMAAMLGRLVAQLKMPRLDAYVPMRRERRKWRTPQVPEYRCGAQGQKRS